MQPETSTLITQFFLFLGGIVTTWLTLRYRDRLATRNREQKPKERMDTIFDGYEKLILQQQTDIERKATQITNTQKIVEQLQKELDDTRELVRQQQDELEESRELNLELQTQLADMKKEYSGAGKIQ